jgi:hypothetical protein
LRPSTLPRICIQSIIKALTDRNTTAERRLVARPPTTRRVNTTERVPTPTGRKVRTVRLKNGMSVVVMAPEVRPPPRGACAKVGRHCRIKPRSRIAQPRVDESSSPLWPSGSVLPLRCSLRP